MGSTAAESAGQKAKRVDDAFNLRVPDRIPLEIAFGYFPAKYAGITCDAAYYDYDAWLDACKRTLSPGRGAGADIAPDDFVAGRRGSGQPWASVPGG